MGLQLADFAHAADPFVDLGELALEAPGLGQGEAARDLIVEDDVNDCRLTLRYQKLAALEHRVDPVEYVSEEGILGCLDLISIEIALSERLWSDQHFNEASDARSKDCREPCQVLLNLFGVLFGSV